MNEQHFRKLLKKQKQGSLSEQEKELLHLFEENKNDVFFTPHQRKNIWYKNIAIAASIALFITASISVYFYTNTTAKVNAKTIEKSTLYGKKLTLTLPKWYHSYINSGSKLIVPEHFSDTIRNVELIGEAFFEVAHKPQKLFVIQSTSFNLKAYQESSIVGNKASKNQFKKRNRT